MLSHSMCLTLFGHRSGVWERGPSRAMDLHLTSCFMIDKVTGHTFEYDKKHKVLKIVDELIEIRVPLAGPGGAAAAIEADAPAGGAAAGGASPLPHAPSRSSSRHRSPPSPIRKMFSAIFGLCKDIRTYQ